MIILGIDPGTRESAAVWYSSGTGSVVSAYYGPNESLPWFSAAELVAIEMIGHYGTGQAVGKDVFVTCLWIGRLWERGLVNGRTAQLLARPSIKAHLCGTAKAKDGNVRQALIDKLGEPGTKKSPGPTYGMKSHLWQALAVAVCAAEGVKPLEI